MNWTRAVELETRCILFGQCNVLIPIMSLIVNPIASPNRTWVLKDPVFSRRPCGKRFKSTTSNRIRVLNGQNGQNGPNGVLLVNGFLNITLFVGECIDLVSARAVEYILPASSTPSAPSPPPPSKGRRASAVVGAAAGPAAGPAAAPAAAATPPAPPSQSAATLLISTPCQWINVDTSEANLLIMTLPSPSPSPLPSPPPWPSLSPNRTLFYFKNGQPTDELVFVVPKSSTSSAKTAATLFWSGARGRSWDLGDMGVGVGGGAETGIYVIGSNVTVWSVNAVHAVNAANAMQEQFAPKFYREAFDAVTAGDAETPNKPKRDIAKENAGPTSPATPKPPISFTPPANTLTLPKIYRRRGCASLNAKVPSLRSWPLERVVFTVDAAGEAGAGVAGSKSATALIKKNPIWTDTVSATLLNPHTPSMNTDGIIFTNSVGLQFSFDGGVNRFAFAAASGPQLLRWPQKGTVAASSAGSTLTLYMDPASALYDGTVTFRRWQMWEGGAPASFRKVD